MLDVVPAVYPLLPQEVLRLAGRREEGPQPLASGAVRRAGGDTAVGGDKEPKCARMRGAGGVGVHEAKD